MENNQQILLARTNLKSDFNNFLKHVQKTFPLMGTIIKTNPIYEGYEDANFYIETNTGKYVLKIYSKSRTTDNIKDYVKVLKESQKLNIPVIKPVENHSITLGSYPDNTEFVYFILTDYFDGISFENSTPQLIDMTSTAKYLAQLNTLSFPVSESYDFWGNKNLLREYSKNSQKINSDKDSLIKPIVEEMLKINLMSFPKSVIHGDIQRKHVLKNAQGKYCILDFGCMAYDPRVIDLSVHLAWFCLGQDTWELRDEIFHRVVEEYTKVTKLSEEEILSLPTLIKASYAAYYFRTSILIDTSRETKEWCDKAKDMIMLSKDWLPKY